MNPFEFLDEFFTPKTRVIGLSVGEDFVILACVVFTQCQRVTDGRTDRRTDRQTDIPIVASTGLAATLTPCKNVPDEKGIVGQLKTVIELTEVGRNAVPH